MTNAPVAKIFKLHDAQTGKVLAYEVTATNRMSGHVTEGRYLNFEELFKNAFHDALPAMMKRHVEHQLIVDGPVTVQVGDWMNK